MKTAILILLTAVAGCASRHIQQTSGYSANGRVATAEEIARAAKTGNIPGWFRPADRQAVERLRH
ncbi:MAG TPA: hypothetical protein VMF06_19080 [Candidatus Limnocylindria bacterium]|jgi:hypothetical protein|nr:hypothetical protein [Candidatus Limnocylindria bacterium]